MNPVDDMLLATPSPGSLGGRLRAVGLGCDGEPAVVVDVRDDPTRPTLAAEYVVAEMRTAGLDIEDIAVELATQVMKLNVRIARMEDART